MRLSVSLTLRRETETEGVESVYRMVYAQDWFMVVLVEIGGNWHGKKSTVTRCPGRTPTATPPSRRHTDRPRPRAARQNRR